MVEPIAAMQGILTELTSLARAAGPSDTVSAAATAPEQAGGHSFSAMFGAAVDRLDGTVGSANAAAKAFASGSDEIPLSDVMISLEQANLALQTAATVRDKVTAAYSAVMNMQL